MNPNKTIGYFLIGLIICACATFSTKDRWYDVKIEKFEVNMMKYHNRFSGSEVNFKIVCNDNTDYIKIEVWKHGNEGETFYKGGTYKADVFIPSYIEKYLTPNN